MQNLKEFAYVVSNSKKKLVFRDLAKAGWKDMHHDKFMYSVILLTEKYSLFDKRARKFGTCHHHDRRKSVCCCCFGGKRAIFSYTTHCTAKRFCTSNPGLQIVDCNRLHAGSFNIDTTCVLQISSSFQDENVARLTCCFSDSKAGS